jgi:c-di-GMP-binding flagellar brake protein YcgR
MCIPERRKFRRVHAPIYCRPAGLLAPLRYETKDISLGGIRVLSDERHDVGKHIDLELLLPNKAFVSLIAQVVWILPNEQAQWEIGLRFVDVNAKDLELLELILENEGAHKK